MKLFVTNKKTRLTLTLTTKMADWLSLSSYFFRMRKLCKSLFMRIRLCVLDNKRINMSFWWYPILHVNDLARIFILIILYRYLLRNNLKRLRTFRVFLIIDTESSSPWRSFVLWALNPSIKGTFPCFFVNAIFNRTNGFSYINFITIRGNRILEIFLRQTCFVVRTVLCWARNSV